jgi:hypothetical protein
MIFPRLRRRNSSTLSVDDASVSSTISVERGMEKLSLKKSVNFNLAVNESHSNKVWYKEDCRELWCKRSDYKLFRESIVNATNAIKWKEANSRGLNSYSRIFEHTYHICNRAVSDTEQFSHLSTAEDRRQLNRLAEVAPVSLERWAVLKLSNERSLRRKEIVQVVLDIQGGQFEDKDEFIRKSCERVSRPGRIFSAAMAQAQVTALLKEQSRTDFFA